MIQGGIEGGLGDTFRFGDALPHLWILACARMTVVLQMSREGGYPEGRVTPNDTAVSLPTRCQIGLNAQMITLSTHEYQCCNAKNAEGG